MNIHSILRFLTKNLDELDEKLIANSVVLILYTVINYFILVIYEEQKLSFSDVIYFTFITHFTVGYGDISPKSNLGRTLTFIHVFITWFINLIPIQADIKVAISDIKSDLDRVMAEKQKAFKNSRSSSRNKSGTITNLFKSSKSIDVPFTSSKNLKKLPPLKKNNKILPYN